MKIIDTITLVASRYGEHDLWISANEYTTTGRWVELRMRSRYSRRVERLSILYTGPKGSTRVEQGGPEVPGPLGALTPQASVISAHPTAKPTYIDVEEGDVLILNGQRMVIADNRPMDYPHLVTEAEWGLIVAQRVLNDKIAELRDPSDPVAHALYALRDTLAEEVEPLRARSRPAPAAVSDAK